MQRIDSTDVSATLPAPQPEGSTVGYFKDPDGILGTQGTQITADWLNGVQEEIANVIVEGGLALNKASQTQLRDAILQIVADNATSPAEVSDQIAAEAIHGTVGTTNERIPVADGVGGQTLKASQVEINSGTMANLTSLHVGAPLATKAASAALEVTSTTGGILLPRLNQIQRDAISSPAEGLMIHDVTQQGPSVFVGSSWEQLAFKNGGIKFDCGDGSDGDATISGAATLTRTMYYQNLTITASGNLDTAGFKIFVKGTLTMAAGGKIQRDGNNGSAAVGQSKGTGGNALNASAFIGSSGAGGDGGQGGSAGSGGLGQAGTATAGMGNSSGASGAGGASTTPSSGGSSSPVVATTYTPVRNYVTGTLSYASTLIQGGSGGSGGGGGGGISGGTPGGGGGGGGSGGGIVWIAASTVSALGGFISAKGGNGGNGANGATGGTGSAGGGGGGAGGGGGCVYLFTHRILGSPSIQVTGGLGGLKGLKGGGLATDGTDGGSGSPGRIVWHDYGSNTWTIQ